MFLVFPSAGNPIQKAEIHTSPHHQKALQLPKADGNSRSQPFRPKQRLPGPSQQRFRPSEKPSLLQTPKPDIVVT